MLLLIGVGTGTLARMRTGHRTVLIVYSFKGGHQRNQNPLFYDGIGDDQKK